MWNCSNTWQHCGNDDAQVVAECVRFQRGIHCQRYEPVNVINIAALLLPPMRLCFIWHLGVCLLAYSCKKNYWSDLPENFAGDVCLDQEDTVNFGSHLHLEPDLGFYKGFFNISRCAVFHSLAHIFEKNDRIFVRILREMHLWTRTSPLNYGSYLNPPWRTSVLSDCSCCS